MRLYSRKQLDLVGLGSAVLALAYRIRDGSAPSIRATRLVRLAG